MDEARIGLLRALSLFAAWSYPPTLAEWVAAWDAGERASPVDRSSLDISSIERAANELARDGIVVIQRGRVTFADRVSDIIEHERRERVSARKRRRAQGVTRWLARIAGTRFVAVCNTTSRSHARDESDIDFFVVTKRGTLWQTRAWAALPFRLLGMRPRTDRLVCDAVCLSFFVDETALNLSSFMLAGDDPDFRHWFLSFLPLYDDGIGEAFWRANVSLTERYPFALSWITNPALRVSRPWFRIPTPTWLERCARVLQLRAMPSTLRSRMNKDTTVVVNDSVLKFHLLDGRATYRARAKEIVARYGIIA